MKKIILSTVLLTVILVFGTNCKNNKNAQNEQQQNQTPETLLRIIKADVPDSIVFTLTQGNEIQWIGVSLVSGDQGFTGETSVKGNMRMYNDEMYCTDQTIFTTTEFKIPVDFKAKQIKFDTGDTILYYDIAAKSWTGK
ncbi:MAG: hypothetical protein LBK94_01785 [Prevotellaceae bacterium]|jgi:hypothetical protein|nr:hypothetical protein [Prevotellaceae bacterium]